MITLLFLTGLFEDLPEATLAAVVIAAVVELVDFAALRGFYRALHGSPRPDLRQRPGPTSSPPWPRMLGVLSSTRCPGLVIGIVVSLLLLLYRASKPHVAELGQVAGARRPVRRPGAPSRSNVDVPGIARVAGRGRVVLRQRRDRAPPQGTARLRHSPGRRSVWLCIDAEAMAFVDLTAVRMLQELSDDLEVRVSS